MFKQNYIQSTGSADDINLLSNITTGDIFLMRNASTGSVVIGNGGATTGNGGGVSIGTGRRCTITIGNLFYNSVLVNSGCCTIHKLQLGNGTGYAGTGHRCVIVGTGLGAGLGGLQTHIIPNAPLGFGLPIVIGTIVGIDVDTNIYVPNIKVTGNDRFTYRKRFFNGSSINDATVESINYVAYWL